MLRTERPPPPPESIIAPDPETRQIASELAAIARTGLVLPGSLTERQMRCGHPGCGCHHDPPRLHGPYWQWTRKVKNKTVTRWLSHQRAADYRKAIDNDRRIRELLARLEQIAIQRLETDTPKTRAARDRPASKP